MRLVRQPHLFSYHCKSRDSQNDGLLKFLVKTLDAVEIFIAFPQHIKINYVYIHHGGKKPHKQVVSETFVQKTGGSQPCRLIKRAETSAYSRRSL